MAVKVDDFGKTGRVETNGKPTHPLNPPLIKKPKSSNVFQALLNGLKSKESSQPVSSLRNKPASSEVVKHDHHRASKNPGAVHGLNAQNVNNLAASALIAMAAISSGPNRIGGIYSQGPEGPVSRAGFQTLPGFAHRRRRSGRTLSGAGNRRPVRSFRIGRKRSGGDRL